MRIGVAIGDLRGPTSWEGLVSQLRVAAAAPFHGAWSAQALGWDALTALAAAGAQVSGIELGTAVVPTPQRHPLTMASQALSVQAATGNRLTLGLGAGIGAMVRGMFGMTGDRPARRMREYLQVLGPLLRGHPVDHHGETLTAVGAVGVPGARPPSILLAALGPEMLRVAGEHADGAVTWMAGPRTLSDHIVPSFSRAAAAAGRPAPRVVAALLVCVTREEAAVRRRVDDQFGMAAVRAGIERMAGTGVTDLVGAPFGEPDDQERTLGLLADVVRTGAQR